MGKSRLLRQGDVRAALRLVGECRDLSYDPGLWTPHMFAGLCRLVGARAGNGGEVRMVRPHGPVVGEAYFDAGLAPEERALYLDYLRAHGIDRHPLSVGFAEWRCRWGRVIDLAIVAALIVGVLKTDLQVNGCFRVFGAKRHRDARQRLAERDWPDAGFRQTVGPAD